MRYIKTYKLFENNKEDITLYDLMNGILESKNDKNEEKRIRVVEIFRVLHLIIYISRVYRKSGTNAEITGYRQLDGSTSSSSL